MAFVTSEFGKRVKPCPTCSEYHPGIDLRAGVGSPIYANQDLKVSRIRDFGQSGYGKSLYVKDPNDPSKEYIFGHLDDNNPGGYKVGDTIPQGTLMAYTGRTGANDQPHLHYEVRQNGVPIPPRPYTGIASFSKNKGNLLTEVAVVDKNRSKKPVTDDSIINDAVKKKLQQLKEEQDRGRVTRERPSGADVGVLINGRTRHHDGSK